MVSSYHGNFADTAAMHLGKWMASVGGLRLHVNIRIYRHLPASAQSYLLCHYVICSAVKLFLFIFTLSTILPSSFRIRRRIECETVPGQATINFHFVNLGLVCREQFSHQL